MSNEWLKELKVGDEVACDFGKYGSCYIKVDKIAHITPTGMIHVFGKTFNANGCYGRGFDSYFLKQLTEELREKYITQEYTYLVKSRWENLLGVTDPILRKQVEDLINNHKKPEKGK